MTLAQVQQEKLILLGSPDSKVCLALNLNFDKAVWWVYQSEVAMPSNILVAYHIRIYFSYVFKSAL